MRPPQFIFLGSLFWLLCPAGLFGQGGGVGSVVEWSAYNDQIAGASTHANATRWGVFANPTGALLNITTGSSLSASLAITNVGAVGSTTMAAPTAGTPAATIFSPYIHWNSGTNEGIQIEAADTVTYVFSGLDPNQRYTFRGTSMRGNNTYTNRWTEAEISGTTGHAAVHTTNVLTNAEQPTALTVNQAAWNSGNNLVGDVVGWDQINPGADGAFSIITTRYSGNYPGGNTETPTVAPYGYGFQALRLEQWSNGPPGPPVAVADAAVVHAGQKHRIPVLQNDTGLITVGSVVITQAPSKGSAVPQSDGTVVYVAQASATGTDVFSYQVAGPGGTASPVAVNITIPAALKIPVTGLNVPASPPPTTYALTPAFGTLSFSSPTCLESPPAEALRLFVCEKGGLLRVIPNVTAATPTAATFLDLPTLLGTRSETLSTNSEQGLLGVAFHPNFASNRFLYVFYSVTRGGITYERLSRFTAQAGNPNLADTASELVLLEQADDAGNHNGGDLHFGPDGYLYVSLGDEGNQNDSLNNSQNIAKDFFSGILRIDVDKKPGSLYPNLHAAVLRDAGVARYAVPPDNPFVGVTTFNGTAVVAANVRTEFWAVGLRNPWRMSFDSATGELWVGDVGSNTLEEVDVVTRGGNYGWAFREGSIAGPKTAPVGFTSIAPVFEYGHGSGVTQGNSITGGLVYRGTRISALTGLYLFADYTSGNLWTLQRNGAAAPTVTRIAGEVGIAAFGSDPSNQDVLVADLDGNRILRLVTSTPGGSFPLTLSATGLFNDLSDLTPTPGMLEYNVNVPFWSDYAKKRRWFAIPNGTSKLTWSQDGGWTLPTGMLWVKHFDLETTRGNPATAKRLETRLFVKTSTGAYGVTYRWNDQQTEATLVPDEGAEAVLAITENGTTRNQRWRFPSRAECASCHNAAAGFALSFNTRQLNFTDQIVGRPGNQLALLASGDFFTNVLPSANLLPKVHAAADTSTSVESRVRSYLEVNCAYCHRPGGPQGSSGADWRILQTLDQTGLLLGNATNNGGDPANKLIVPGDLLHSIVLNRVAAANGFTRMPPIGTTETDPSGIALLTEWIGTKLPQRETYAQWRLAQFGSANSPAGDPANDADADGQSNAAEYASRTDPRSGSSFPVVAAQSQAGSVTLNFTVPENHTWMVEESANLQAWSRWNAPGNNGSPAAGGPVSVTGPAATARAFYRVTITGD